MPVKIDPELGLPRQYTDWRDDQWKAVQAINRSDRPCFLLDGPPGVGKSLIGVGVQRMMGEPMVYITRTKQLQRQIMRDFGDIATTLMGRANYPCCLKYDQFPEVTAEDCHYADSPRSCAYYSKCEYYCAKEKAKNSDLVVLNDAYFLNEANGYQTAFGNRKVLVVDEVDSIENGLMNYVQFTITAKQLDKLGLKKPANSEIKEGWLQWIPQTLADMDEWVEKLKLRLNCRAPQSWGAEEVHLNRTKKSFEKLMEKLFFITREADWSWVFYTRENNGSREWVFKPVDVSKYAHRYLWRHGEFCIGMSGTIFSADLTCRDLGIDDCDYMRLECPFPERNRPIYFKPVVNLSRESMNRELPILCQNIDADLREYPNEKVLIHTVSYQTQNYLLNNLSCRRRLLTHDSSSREDALREFIHTREPLVFLSPSMDRGVDLREEVNCGCVMICKMPYLDLSDPQISAKMKLPGGGQWYSLKTLQTLVQMSLRSVRNERQRCDCRIYDRQFARIRTSMRDVIPAWWSRAIVEIRPGIEQTGLLI